MSTSRNKGQANPFYGRKHTPQELKKMSLAQRGRKLPLRSKEWRQHISESKRGKNTGMGNPFFGKKHTEETRKLIALKHRADPKFKRCGEKHWNWQGGITEKIWGLRHTNEAKKWRRAVFERDNYTCQKCGVKACRKHPIQAHHIKPFAEYPELGFEVSNGITLCIDCHRQIRRPTKGQKGGISNCSIIRGEDSDGNQSNQPARGQNRGSAGVGA